VRLADCWAISYFLLYEIRWRRPAGERAAVPVNALTNSNGSMRPMDDAWLTKRVAADRPRSQVVAYPLSARPARPTTRWCCWKSERGRVTCLTLPPSSGCPEPVTGAGSFRPMDSMAIGTRWRVVLAITTSLAASSAMQMTRGLLRRMSVVARTPLAGRGVLHVPTAHQRFRSSTRRSAMLRGHRHPAPWRRESPSH
jgi:hypothetical protein